MLSRGECRQGDQCRDLEEGLASEGEGEFVQLVSLVEYLHDDFDREAEEGRGVRGY